MAWPIRAQAQEDTKLPLVAVLDPGTEELFKPRLAAVRGRLKKEGLVEGRDYVLEARFASSDFSRLPRLADAAGRSDRIAALSLGRDGGFS